MNKPIQPPGLIVTPSGTVLRAAFTSLALAALSIPPVDATAAQPEIKCRTNVVACLKKAFKRCPKNVTFIQDRSTKLGFKVLPHGTPLTEANIRGRPTYTVCAPK